MERAARRLAAPHAVERIRLLEGARIHELDRIERRAGLVVGGNAVEVGLDQGAAGDPARREPGVHAGDGGFHDLKLLGGERQRKRQPKSEEQGATSHWPPIRRRSSRAQLTTITSPRL
jgi:hypothetical protein